VEKLAKDLGDTKYEDKAINLSELKKGQLAKDLGLTKDEVDAKGYAKTFFEDYLKVADVKTNGGGGNEGEQGQFSYSDGDNLSYNIPSKLYLGELAFVDWGFGLPVSKDAPTGSGNP
jgi:hypothetical protein